MKAAIYARVSKDEASSDGKLQDTDNQLLPCRKYCEAMNWDVKYEFIDRVSGGNSNRPGFKQMMSHVRQRHIDIIVIWSLDRFSRESVSNTLSYIKQLRTYKCGLKSIQESWLDTSQEGVTDLLLAIFAWVAEQERIKISERTKAALAKLKARGVRLGRPPKKAPPKNKEVIYK